MPSVSNWKVPSAVQPKPEDYGYDLDQALSSVVGLHATVPADAFTAETLGTERAGNGVFIRGNGLVLTIGYLITEADTIWIALNDGRSVPGHVLGYDQESGFGLVQALAKLDVPSLEIGDSAAASIGERVVVGGFGGRQRSVAARIVAKQEFAGYWEYVLEEAIFTSPAHPNWGGTALIGPAGDLLGIGSLQLLLDRGEELGWFGSGEIWIEAIVSAFGFYYFFAHSLTTDEPFIRFEMFKDRNFTSGVVFMVVIGVVLFGTMALVTPFMQNLLGYPIQTAGFLLGSRGVGTLITMMVAPRLMRLVETRWLVLAGLLITGTTLSFFTQFSLDTKQWTIVWTSIMQGIGLGLLFVPISTAAFGTLPGHLRTGGTAILTLLRNIGSSVGISIVIAQLTSNTNYMHARLIENVTPFNQALQMPDVSSIIDVTSDAGRALLDSIVTQQAVLLAYLNDYKFLMYATFAVIPLIFIFGSSRKQQAVGGHDEPVVME